MSDPTQPPSLDFDDDDEGGGPLIEGPELDEKTTEAVCPPKVKAKAKRSKTACKKSNRKGIAVRGTRTRPRK